VNEIHDLSPVDGAYDAARTKHYAFVEDICGIRQPVIIGTTANVVAGGLKFSYSLQTAQVAMRRLLDACARIYGP
jgi:hypothetical protein